MPKIKNIFKQLISLINTGKEWKMLLEKAKKTGNVVNPMHLHELGIYRFLKNIGLFRKQLWSYIPGDFSFDLLMYQQCLRLTRNNMLKYLDFDHSKDSLESIQKTIELIDILLKEDFSDIVNEELGYSWQSKNITNYECKIWMDYYQKVEDEHWEELFRLQKDNIRGWWV